MESYKFEEGKAYGNGLIRDYRRTVTKRTRCYVTLDNGTRLKVRVLDLGNGVVTEWAHAANGEVFVYANKER